MKTYTDAELRKRGYIHRGLNYWTHHQRGELTMMRDTVEWHESECGRRVEEAVVKERAKLREAEVSRLMRATHKLRGE